MWFPIIISIPFELLLIWGIIVIVFNIPPRSEKLHIGRGIRPITPKPIFNPRGEVGNNSKIS